MSKVSPPPSDSGSDSDKTFRRVVIGTLGLAAAWSIAARAMSVLYDFIYIGSVVLAMDVVLPPENRKATIEAVRTKCAPLIEPAWAWTSQMFSQGRKAIEDELEKHPPTK